MLDVDVLSLDTYPHISNTINGILVLSVTCSNLGNNLISYFCLPFAIYIHFLSIYVYLNLCWCGIWCLLFYVDAFHMRSYYYWCCLLFLQVVWSWYHAITTVHHITSPSLCLFPALSRSLYRKVCEKCTLYIHSHI